MCCYEPFRREFEVQNFGCIHESPNELVKSQWQSRTKSNIFLIYRVILAIIYTGVVIWSITNHVRHFATIGYYFIYLTNWGIMLCMICTVLGCVLVGTWHFHPDFADSLETEMPIMFKVYWSLHNISLILSIMITALYWGIIYDKDRDTLDALNFMTHATNSIFMTIDLLVVAHPIRLFHFYQPLLVGAIYGLFSYIYYLAGGVDGHGDPWIYEPLDWSKPLKAFSLICIATAAVICLHFFMFWVYQFRIYAYKSCFDRESDRESENPDDMENGGYPNLSFTSDSTSNIHKQKY